MTIAYKKPKYNQELPNIVTGLEEQTSTRTKSVLTQPIRNLEATIQVLDDKGNITDTITGHVTSGSINYDATSLIRRTGQITMIVDPAYMPSNKSVFWFGKRFRLYQGVIDMSTSPHEEVNFLLGTYWVDDTTLYFDEDQSSITVNLSDKMTLLDGLGLETKLRIDIGTPISDCIRQMMELAGETDFGYMYTSDSKEVMPYKYEKEVGKSITDIITDLRDMYMDFICGYDALGRFEFRKIETQKEDTNVIPKWNFDATSDRADLTLSFSETYTLKDVKNRVVVVGNTSTNTGYTPKGVAKITDATSKFNIDAIGTRTKVIQNNDLTNDLQCSSQAMYELWKISHFQETVSISVIPVYSLQPYDVITVTNPVTHKANKYMIDTIQVDLGVDGTMYITAHKMYYVGMTYNMEDSVIVAAIKHGINDLGWLSLGEQRIKDAYGISGDGKGTIIVRFITDSVGGEQAAVTGYVTTTNQTMEIDTKDYEHLNIKSQDGDAGRSKCFMRYVTISIVLLSPNSSRRGGKKDSLNWYMVLKSGINQLLDLRKMKIKRNTSLVWLRRN